MAIKNVEEMSGGGDLRVGRGFASLELNWKLFLSMFQIVAAFCYASLLGSIWYDSQMSPALVLEGYGSMDPIELTQHSFKYLFWFFSIFGVQVFLFQLTGLPSRVKTFLAVVVPTLILVDISAAWLIQWSDVFAYVLCVSGLLLAVSFLFMFLCIQWELWFRRPAKEVL